MIMKQMIYSKSPDHVLQNYLQDIHIIKVWNFLEHPEIDETSATRENHP